MISPIIEGDFTDYWLIAPMFEDDYTDSEVNRCNHSSKSVKSLFIYLAQHLFHRSL